MFFADSGLAANGRELFIFEAQRLDKRGVWHPPGAAVRRKWAARGAYAAIERAEAGLMMDIEERNLRVAHVLQVEARQGS